MARPTKLTPDVQDKIVQAIRGGNYREIAAQWAGIDERTFIRWMGLGKTRPNSAYVAFRHAVIEAEREAEIRGVARLVKAAIENPDHMKWWLERKFPERWGRREHMTIAGDQELPVLVVRKRG